MLATDDGRGAGEMEETEERYADEVFVEDEGIPETVVKAAPESTADGGREDLYDESPVVVEVEGRAPVNNVERV